jgi:hypothetical protein
VLESYNYKKQRSDEMTDKTEKNYPHYDYLTNKELSYEDRTIVIVTYEQLMQDGVNPLDIMVEAWDVQYTKAGDIHRELHISYKKP